LIKFNYKVSSELVQKLKQNKVMTLKEATAELHSKAEKMMFNQRMFRGELSQFEYLNYLIQQSYIFQEIEGRNLPHPNLKRLRCNHNDISELGGYTFKISKPTTDYVLYLGDLNQNQLNAHIYLELLSNYVRWTNDEIKSSR
jgi:hypothetical protein